MTRDKDLFVSQFFGLRFVVQPFVAGRISPDKPTSPAKQILSEIAMSSLEDKIAATTHKSIDGSSTFMPPVFKNVLAPSRNPSFFQNS